MVRLNLNRLTEEIRNAPPIRGGAQGLLRDLFRENPQRPSRPFTRYQTTRILRQMQRGFHSPSYTVQLPRRGRGRVLRAPYRRASLARLRWTFRHYGI